jgi:ATP adenylyltransferase
MSSGEAPSPTVPGLAQALEDRTREALACGALRPIETTQEVIEDGGVHFLVRVVSSLARKAREAAEDRSSDGPPPANPFLPPERALTVAPIGADYLAVLNKFNVLERHLLVVTRAFVHQETLLTPADLDALFACMAQVRGLGFYNGGAAAGASQPHRHLQLVPLPLAAEGPAVPMAPLLAGGPARGIGVCPGLPFRHAFARLSRPVAAGAGLAAEAHGLYLGLLASLGIGRTADGRQSAPYNLLVAEDWMLLVPRVAESFGTVSVNALGFAGSLFVPDQGRLAAVRAAGPLALLRAVTG